MAEIYTGEKFHPGTVGFAAVFDDGDGEGKEPAHMDSFVAALSEVAEAHGFKLKTWGQRRNVERFLVRSRLIAIVDHLVEASDDDSA